MTNTVPKEIKSNEHYRCHECGRTMTENQVLHNIKHQEQFKKKYKGMLICVYCTNKDYNKYIYKKYPNKIQRYALDCYLPTPIEIKLRNNKVVTVFTDRHPVHSNAICGNVNGIEFNWYLQNELPSLVKRRGSYQDHINTVTIIKNIVIHVLKKLNPDRISEINERF
jgi:RNA polymerase subunit RPABC4/transcription elongation factor Spt4